MRNKYYGFLLIIGFFILLCIHFIYGVYRYQVVTSVILLLLGIALLVTLSFLLQKVLKPVNREAINNRYLDYLEKTITNLNNQLTVLKGWFKFEFTERKLNEIALKEINSFYSNLLNTMDDGFIVIGKDSIITYVNNRLCEFIGYTRGDIINKTPYFFIDDSSIDIYKQNFSQQVDSESYELVLRGSGGNLVCVVVSQRVVLDRGNCFNGIFAVFTDITRRKELENALIESQQSILAFLSAIPETFIITSPVGNIIAISNMGIKRFNKSVNELIGENVFSLLPLFEKYYKEVIKSRVPIYFISSEGSVYFYNTIYPILSSGGIREVAIFSQDITEGKRVDNKKLREQKIESLILFSRGVAHDFKNILSIIGGELSLIRLHTRGNKFLTEGLENAELGLKQAGDLSKQLESFAMGNGSLKTIINISRLLTECIGLCLRGSNIDINISIDKELWSVFVDIHQITQVINNIIINAREAMDNEGYFGVHAYNKVDSLDGEDKSWVVIAFRDSGKGIAEEYIEKVFDPYFSQKPSGTGLGLAITRSIIDSHGGRVEVESKVNHGTTFYIYLPVVSDS